MSTQGTTYEVVVAGDLYSLSNTTNIKNVFDAIHQLEGFRSGSYGYQAADRGMFTFSFRERIQEDELLRLMNVNNFPVESLTILGADDTIVSSRSFSIEPQMSVESMTPVVIDTCVMIDIFLETRRRHKEAKELGTFLIQNNVEIRMPTHAMFEIASALQNESMNTPLKMQNTITEKTPLNIYTIPIDAAFFNKYFNQGVPYLKAGDRLFVALAKGGSFCRTTH